MKTLQMIGLLSGPDRPGLVAEAARWIADRRGNIHHADQHRDAEAGVFLQRLEWSHDDLPGETEARAELAAFRRFGEQTLGMRVRCALSTDRPRVALMVSRQAHCFHDLILRFQSGEMPGALAGVISNHPDLGEATSAYGLPFEHVPVQAANKASAEARQLAILHGWNVELVVMARYMQVLSPSFLERAGCPVINIHHSFLPAFMGARPYHQAHARGVKLIGATAHYATNDLDEGPIIAQDVTRISHRHTPADLIRRGRDLEKIVLAQAVRWHLEHRVLVYGNKTVVFD